jgi:hypothetical protein
MGFQIMDDYNDHWGNNIWMVLGKIGLAFWWVLDNAWWLIKKIYRGIMLVIAYIIYGVR